MDNLLINGCIITSSSKKYDELDVLYEHKNVRELLEKDGTYLEYVRVQTDTLCRIAIITNWKALQFVRNQTEELCLLALNINPNAIQYVRNLTIQLCVFALRKDERVIDHIKEFVHKYGRK